MPDTLTMGMLREPYWAKTFELCQALNIPPTEPIKEVLREWMPLQNQLLEKKLEQARELQTFKKKLESERKGGDNKKN